MSQTALRHIRALLLYSVLTVILTLPVSLLLRTHIAGTGGDPWQTLWRFENLQQQAVNSVQQGTISTFVLEQFFGQGEPRLVNNSVWLWMSFHMLFGQPFAYNLVWLLSFVLSGYFMYLLVSFLLTKQKATSKMGNAYGPLLAGVLYMFLPYHVAHSYGHFGAMQTQWLPLALLLTFLFAARPTIWRALGLVLTLTIQSWTEHHYLLWYALFLLAWLAVRVKVIWQRRYKFPISNFNPVRNTDPQGPDARPDGTVISNGIQFPQVLPVILLVVLVSTFALLPWWPTVRLATSSDSLNLGTEQTVRFSADLFSFVAPAAFHPVWGFLVSLFTDIGSPGNVAEATHYLGIIPLLFVIFFVRSVPKAQRYLWVAVAAVFAILSLGPRLHLAGIITPLPLPWAILDSLPIFSSIRAVGRATVMVGLAFSVLFGFVAATQIRRAWVAAVLGVFIVLEFLFYPIPLQSAQLPAVYAEIDQVAEGQRIIEIPARTNYTASSKALYASTQHGKEVVGLIALERARASATDEEAQSLPGLRQVLHVRTTDLRELRSDFFNQDLAESFLESLAWLDVGAVLVHIDSLSQLQEASLERFFAESAQLTPTDAHDALLYYVPDWSPELGDGVLLSRDGRWNVSRTEDGTVFAGLDTEASVMLYNITDETKDVTLSWSAPAAEVAVSGSSAPLPLTVTDDVLHELTVQLPPGTSEFTFRNLASGSTVLTNPVMTVVQ